MGVLLLNYFEILTEIEILPFPYTSFAIPMEHLLFTNTAEWKHGGYEPSASVFTPMAENDITEAVINYLNGNMKLFHLINKI